jgi:hypothetical protein
MNAGHPAVTRRAPRRAGFETTHTGVVASVSHAETRDPSATSRSARVSRTEARESLAELDPVRPSRAEALEALPDLDPVHISLAEAREIFAESDSVRTMVSRNPPSTRRADAGGTHDSIFTA